MIDYIDIGRLAQLIYLTIFSFFFLDLSLSKLFWIYFAGKLAFLDFLTKKKKHENLDKMLEMNVLC